MHFGRTSQTYTNINTTQTNDHLAQSSYSHRTSSLPSMPPFPSYQALHSSFLLLLLILVLQDTIRRPLLFLILRLRRPRRRQRWGPLALRPDLRTIDIEQDRHRCQCECNEAEQAHRPVDVQGLEHLAIEEWAGGGEEGADDGVAGEGGCGAG